MVFADPEFAEDVKKKRTDYIINKFAYGNTLNSKSSDNFPLLYHAIMTGDATFVDFCLRNGANPNIIVQNMSLLMIAAHKRNSDIVGLLIQAGASPHFRSSNGKTALNYANDEIRRIITGYYRQEMRKRKICEAASENNINEVLYLLTIGKNIDETDDKKMTPFMIACANGYLSLAHILVKFGCNIDAVDANKNNAIIHAIANHKPNILVYLHNIGMKFDSKIDGKSLLMIAIENHDIDAAQILIQYGMDINYVDPHGYNALFYAIQNDFPNCIPLLATQNTFNAKVNDCDAMMFACLNGKLHCVEQLIALNFIPNQKDAFLMSVRGDQVLTANYWMKHGVDVDSTNSDDESALMISLKYGLVLSGFLINHHANVRFINSKNESALTYSVFYEKIIPLEFILDDFLQGDLFNHIMHALNVAIELDNYDEAKLIISRISDHPKFTNKGLLVKCDSKEMRNLFLNVSKADLPVKIEKGSNILKAAAAGNIPEIIYYLYEIPKSIEVKSKIGLTPFLAACTSGQLNAVKYLVSMGADLNATTEENANALAISCEFGHLNVVKYLIEEQKFDMNSYLIQGKTPMCIAAENGHINIMEYLVNKGVDPQQKSLSGDKPIYYAVKNNKSEAFEFLLARGGDINELSSDGQPLLVTAYTNNYPELTQLIIDRGANLSIINKVGMNFLHFICGKGDMVLATLALHHGLDVNKQRSTDNATPYIMACYSGNIELMQYLENNGANTKVLTRNSITPFYAVCEGGNLIAVQHLISLNVDTKTRDIYYISPFLAACKSGKFDVVKYLISTFPDCLNDTDVNQCNAFYYACQSGNIDLVTFLYQTNTFDVNARYWNKNTALHTACYNGHLDVVKFLLKRKADLFTATSSGSFPIHLAAKNNKVSVVEYLIKEDKRLLEIRGPKMNTPFMMAALNEAKGVCKYLMSKKANIYTRNDTGLTPMHLAAAQGNLRMLKMLLKIGFDVNEVLNRETPLSRSAMYNQWDCVKFLIEHSAQKESATTLSALHRTVEENRLTDFKHFIKLGFDVNEEGEMDRNPLIVATIKGFDDFIDYLLANNAVVNKLDSKPYSALNYAIDRGDIETIKKLIQHRADVNVSLDEITPFIQAIRVNNKEIFDLLYLQGAFINVTSKSGIFPIHEAATSNDLYYIENLVKWGSFIDQPTVYDWRTPLMFAVLSGNQLLFKWIIDQQANIYMRDIDGNSAFGLSMISGKLDFAETLIQRGADLNETDYRGNTIVCKVCSLNHKDSVYFLIDRGAFPNAFDSNHNTLLNIAISQKDFMLANYLIDKGAFPTLPGISGQHAIHLLATFDMDESLVLIKRFLDMGEDINVKDEFDETPLHYTNWMREGKTKIASFIKRCGGRDFKFETKTKSDIDDLNKKIRSIQEDIDNNKRKKHMLKSKNELGTDTHINAQIRSVKFEIRNSKNELTRLNRRIEELENLITIYNAL